MSKCLCYLRSYSTKEQQVLTQKRIDFIFYVIECLVGTLIGYSLYQAYPIVGAWCLISILLVISPDRKDAMTLAVNRIKANLVGAGVGLFLFYIHPINLFSICAGIAATLIICEILKLQSAARSAIIAVLIITMHEPGESFWNIAVERAFSVMLGCAIGVLLTFLFHFVILKFKTLMQNQSK